MKKSVSRVKSWPDRNSDPCTSEGNSDVGTLTLDMYSSGEAIGAILSQLQDGFERVIYYGSRVCTSTECNYDGTKRELLAIVYFLKTFRQYLLGRSFILFSSAVSAENCCGDRSASTLVSGDRGIPV